MKKAMIIFAILLIPVFSLQAGIRIGAKAGINIAKPSFNSDVFKTDNFTGFQVGPVIEISGLTGFGVDAAILYSQHGLKAISNPPSYSSAYYKSKYEEKVSTLDVPVNLKMKFSLVDIIGCYLSAGPYISFKLEDKVSLDKVKAQWESKQFGVGLNFGAGIELLKHLQVGVNYQFALNEDYSEINSMHDVSSSFKDALNAKTRMWSITAVYFF